MSFKTLVTLNGHAPYDADIFKFEVLEGGALKISGQGAEDLIGPGFWVAVLDSTSEDRLDWDFLAPQRPARVGEDA